MLKQLIPALRATIVLAVFTGIIFPLAIFAIGHALFPFQANGSLLNDSNGKVIGSVLVAQGFTKPQYFHPRPSAAGSGYAGEASGGTNLGPTSQKLIIGDKDFPGIKQLAEAYRKDNGLAADARVPADAVTRSGSGLDPDISPANALLQVKRVATARNLPESTVRDLLVRHIQDRQLALLGEPRVNVLMLNLDLDKIKK